MPFKNEWTCIGCGLQAAKAILDKSKRVSASKVVITVTDGENNKPDNKDEHLANAAEELKKDNVTVFAIGIGDKVKDSELEVIKTNDDNLETKFTVGNVGELSSILEKLLSATCMAKNLDECNCDGFCGVDNECLCPSLCQPFDGDKCKQAYQCSKTSNGCFFRFFLSFYSFFLSPSFLSSFFSPFLHLFIILFIYFFILFFYFLTFYFSFFFKGALNAMITMAAR